MASLDSVRTGRIVRTHRYVELNLSVTTSTSTCDCCGAGITSVTHRVNCGYCKRCGGVESVAFYLPKTLRGPADVAAVAAELTRREHKLLLQHWQRVQAQQLPGDELLKYSAEQPQGSSIEIHSGVLWQRGDELLSVLPLDQETRKWRETEDTEFDCVKSRFATAGEIAACPSIAAELRRGDRVLHYEYWELDAVRRLERMYELAKQPREFTRLLELHHATLLMEGRTGLVLLRDWQCVLRVCMDAVLVEEPF